jgi:hypothetical protein
LRITVATSVIPWDLLYVAYYRLLELDQAVINLVASGFPAVVESFHQRHLLAIDQHRHPSVLVRLVFRLEMVSPIVCKASNVKYTFSPVPLTRNQIEAAFVVRHYFNLAGEQVHFGRWFTLVGMTDLQITLRLNSALSFLPDSPHFSFGFLE